MGTFNGIRTAATPARPARFDGTVQHRRSMLAKVHIAKVQLGLADDDYRAVLLRVAGRTSAGDCTDRELVALIEEFTAKGFSAQVRKPGRKPGSRPADHPGAAKARALWISLGHLGAIADPSEPALEAFARRQLGCARMQWANQALGYRLIEALKAIAARHGWDQSTQGVAPGAVPLALTRRLVAAQVAKLRDLAAIPPDWSIERAVLDLTGIEFGGVFGELEEMRRAAAALGAKLAELRA